MSAKPVQPTLVTRERVVAPPDRFIDVTDSELVSYFQGVFPAAESALVLNLREMLDGMCNSGFSRLRQALEQDYAYFAHAAAAEPGTDPRERDPVSAAADLDAQEARFLSNFMELLGAGQYKLLTAAEWDAACAEEFLVTLPVGVNWAALDDQLLPRALWPQHPEERSQVPEELADRMLIFHRGVDVARMRGTYIMRKIDLLLSFFLLQPLFRLFAFIMGKLGVKKFVPDAPSYLAPVEGAAATSTDEQAQAAAAASAAAVNAGVLHEASINIERQTFARTFPDGKSVMGKLMKRVELREACFKDVVVLYRKAAPNAAVAQGEMEIVKDADPAFVQRNLYIKRFSSIPLADLEMVFPDKKIFMPPQVLVNMIISVVGILVTVITAISRGLSFKVVGPTLTMLATRAFSVYTTYNIQVTTIGRAMQRILYERTVASQRAVLSSLTEDMANQRTRELLVAYCVLLSSSTPLTADELDLRCENFLAAQYGLRVDFTCEMALPQLQEWGLVTPTVPTGAVTALPLPAALLKLDEAWDSIYDFSVDTAVTGAVSKAIKVPGKMLSSVFGKTSNAPAGPAPPPAPRPAVAAAAVTPATSSSAVGTSPAVSPNARKRSLFSKVLAKANVSG